ncbi:hypothetical protein NIES46_44420 [Arthrospira platensis NIES-46]|jgi:hypothetical protein|uniref:Uncharacterized protein n=1 Tax=Limnospira platensis NIES-46 TaxID=1236695 RepID=A0A5M3TCA8_LIMPL|nr:hypothetical protein [Arthrospira platensis]GCE96372.1 hypothetical protein NIES46_44420 [Arthrospira platensis NIES-46]
MTPNDKVIITAFIHALARFNRKLPINVYNQLAMISDVANHTKQLESVAMNYTDLAILYKQECDRLLSEVSDRKKGYLPSFDSDDYNTELSNLAEQICHSPDPVTASKNALNPSVGGKIQGFFSQLFKSSPSL